jgi:hypothetical protein
MQPDGSTGCSSGLHSALVTTERYVSRTLNAWALKWAITASIIVFTYSGCTDRKLRKFSQGDEAKSVSLLQRTAALLLRGFSA